MPEGRPHAKGPRPARAYLQQKAKQQKATETKNGLENYCYTTRNILKKEKLQHNSEAEGKERIEKAVKDTLEWLDMNQLAKKGEFEVKRSELEGIVIPIMMKTLSARAARA